MATALRFAPLSHETSWVINTKTIVVTTNNPVHMYLRWTRVEPVLHMHPRMKRGEFVYCVPKWCFVQWQDIEQEEPGDTTTHTFIFPDWLDGEQRWYYFWATSNGEVSPSITAIFTQTYHELMIPVYFTVAIASSFAVDLTCTQYYTYWVFYDWVRRAQRLDNFNAYLRTIYFRLWRSPTGTGVLLCRLRQVSDDAILLQSPDSYDVRDITTGSPLWYPFTFPSTWLGDKSVRISLEGDPLGPHPCLYQPRSRTDICAGIASQFIVAGEWVDYPAFDWNLQLNPMWPIFTIDLDVDTYWQPSSPVTAQWIRWDCGSYKYLNSLQLLWSQIKQYRPSYYTIQARPPGEYWQTIYVGNTTPPSPLMVYKFAPINTRYLRLNIITQGTLGTRIDEASATTPNPP